MTRTSSIWKAIGFERRKRRPTDGDDPMRRLDEFTLAAMESSASKAARVERGVLRMSRRRAVLAAMLCAFALVALALIAMAWAARADEPGQGAGAAVGPGPGFEGWKAAGLRWSLRDGPATSSSPVPSEDPGGTPGDAANRQ